MKILSGVIAPALCAASLLFSGALGATERALSLLLLPPISGEDSPQLAISWRGSQTGRLELSTLTVDGQSRVLQTRELEPGMVLQGVALAASDQTLLAVLRDTQGRELARAESGAQPEALRLGAAAPASAGRADVIQHALRPEGSAPEWKSIYSGNEAPNAIVHATTIYDDGTGPTLVIGGEFTTASGAAVNRIARWNGSAWSALGSGGGNGVDGSVFALVGAGRDLYVGGNFRQANVGGSLVAANSIARWNGSVWSALGSGGGNGLIGAVEALTVSGSDLYVGGQFDEVNVGGSVIAANNIARWNGSAWSALGSGGGAGVDSAVLALAVSGSDLYVGGFFTRANVGATTVAANFIARWNGRAWSALGSGGGNGVSSEVRALAVSGSDLYVGGGFSRANLGGAVVAANRIARWNESGWSALGSDAGNGVSGTVYALAVSGSDLYVGGRFTQANIGGTVAATNYIARWNGSAWSALGNAGGDGLTNIVFALAIFGSDLYAAGDFLQASFGGTPVEANRIARWSGSAWSALGNSGLNGRVLDMTMYDDGRGPALVVGGIFTTIGGVLANNIARWNGSVWSTLGGSGGNGVIGAAYGGVSALAVSGGDLYVGGIFTHANVGGEVVAANNIAHWNGAAWSAVGSGAGNGLDGGVGALAVSGGDLFVGGQFTQANVGGTLVAANQIARWNGSAWSPLGSGGGNGLNISVNALAVSGSDLYVGGAFTQANVGGTVVAANRIARWDGSAWSALGSAGGNGVNGFVNAVAVSGNDLFVGGQFTQANFGGTVVAANRIARWNGSIWSALGSGGGNGVDLAGSAFGVTSLSVSGSDLYVGGSFTQANVGGPSLPANWIARWNGSTWSTLGNGGGNGVNNEVRALAISGGNLYASGPFTQANSGGTAVVAANGLAAYGVTDSSMTVISSTQPIPSRAGEPVRVRARVVASAAPTAGQVTIAGSPGGSCSDLTMTPISTTTSEVECTIQWNTVGPRNVTATYFGGSNSTSSWQLSTSAPYAHMVVAADLLFIDGFETLSPQFLEILNVGTTNADSH